MRSAIIGLGVIGNVHAKLLSLQGEEIVALCDVDSAAAETVREKYAKDAKIYTDYIQMLDAEKPDVVHICTPHYLHAEMVIAALSRNINTLCEKPLCIHREEIDAILEAEAASDAILGVCHQNRYLASNLFTKAYLADKKVLGAHGSVVWNRDAAYYATGAWRGKWATEGGGSLINQALHTLDLTMWFCGDPETAIATTANLTLKNEIEVEDTVFARFEGDTPFTFLGTNTAGADIPVEICLHLADHTQLTVLPYTVLIGGVPVPSATVKRESHGKECYGSGHEALIADFYDCVKKGKHFAIDGREGARVIRLILAAYASHGERVKIN